ncbi:MAG: hypothetical protein EXR12_07895 [Rhodospirillaceae bacterium]|nr:hypothetical protein [Rhodospirillaceae bacterium]
MKVYVMPARPTAKRSTGIVLLAALLVLPLVARAQEVPTVRIGQVTKKTVGTVTATNGGDVACYLSLKDDRGAVFEEMADFEICNQKPPLKGKRVTLTYALQKVMSDECQGDPACKKTRTVALVSAARIIDASSVTNNEAKPAARRTSFCTPAETVVFACRTGAKMASVCASKDTGPKGTLQYRFGKLDGSEPLEQILPEGQVAPGRAASGESVPFSGGGGAWLRFRKGQFTYTVYTGIGNWGPKGEKRTKAGLHIEHAGKPLATLKCQEEPISLLGPDWFEKTGIKPNNEDFDFPD